MKTDSKVKYIDLACRLNKIKINKDFIRFFVETHDLIVKTKGACGMDEMIEIGEKLKENKGSAIVPEG